jgi:hypothetical protein
MQEESGTVDSTIPLNATKWEVWNGCCNLFPLTGARQASTKPTDVPCSKTVFMLNMTGYVALATAEFFFSFHQAYLCTLYPFRHF